MEIKLKTSEWLNKNIDGCRLVKDETMTIISDFTLMWSVFEAAEGNNTEMVQQVNEISKRVAETMPIDAIDDLIFYWKSVYEKSHRRFIVEMRFRDKRQKELVIEVLTSETSTLQKKIEAALLIVYRYRNNLFHGLKDILRMNGQIDNFKHAIDLLQRVLESSGRHVYLGRVGRII